MPMRFTIAMAWTIVIPGGRTQSAGRYITLPDMGVGACGRNMATQPLSSGSSKYPICQPPKQLQQKLSNVTAYARIQDPAAVFANSPPHAFGIVKSGENSGEPLFAGCV
jgi:hypothetical protein